MRDLLQNNPGDPALLNLAWLVYLNAKDFQGAVNVGNEMIRVDTAAHPGYRVPPFYDSLIAKLIVRGDDRADAIARMESALAEFEVEGIATTIPFSLALLGDDAVRAGAYDVGLVERRLANTGRIPS